MKRLTVSAVWLVVAMLGGGCMAGPGLGDGGEDDDALDLDSGLYETQSQAVVGGKKEKNFKTVGFFARPDGGQLCTGTLIKKNVVLTAAHCFTDDATGQLVSPTGYVFGLGTEMDNPTQRIGIRQIVVPGNYDPQVSQLHDIALVFLKKDAKNVKPAKLGTMRLMDRNVEDADCGYQYFGYGLTTTGPKEQVINEPDPNIGTRKTAQQCVYAHDGNDIYARGKKGGICFGDSGGPLMDRKKTHIYGVLSTNGTYGNVEWRDECFKGNTATFTSLTGELEFINQVLKRKPSSKRDEDGSSISSASRLGQEIFDYDDEESGE